MPSDLRMIQFGVCPEYTPSVLRGALLEFGQAGCVPGGQDPFKKFGREPDVHLFGIEISERPGSGDYRNIDVRENVSRSSQADHWACDQDQKSHDDERIWPLEREFDNPHTTPLLDLVAFGLFSAPGIMIRAYRKGFRFFSLQKEQKLGR